MSDHEEASLSIRINLANGGRFGPGKAALLRAIAEAGSIRAAAQALSMSYPRALKLIEEMNADFADPLVQSSVGGSERGGSALSDTGKAVLAAYDDVCAEAGNSTGVILERLSSLQSLDQG
ncbi:MAG: LysR family transcriptional regulator [Henriciella sp.]|uniref:winged helix-turn-helix domain-containing protein n=1 Tax=Henriciella sp. TaxID=1968823 RepID=UPI00262B0E26|nr:LysR family transcriptional regulator [Henriciella sp.]